MTSSRTRVIESIVVEFSSRHVRSPRVFLPRRKADRESLGKLGIPRCDPAVAPDVVIHDQERDWLFLFDAASPRRHMNEPRRENLAAQFASCGKGLVFFSAFTDLESFSRVAESIAWETEVWISDAPDHMIHFNGDRFLGPSTYNPTTFREVA